MLIPKFPGKRLDIVFSHCITAFGINKDFAIIDIPKDDIIKYDDESFRAMLDYMCMVQDTLITKKVENKKELYTIGKYALSFKKLQGGFENYINALKKERRNRFWNSRIAVVISIVSLILSLLSALFKIK